MYTNYTSYITDKCRGCENNCGGVCCYDLNAEAEERGVRLEDIRHDDFCAYYDRAED